MHRIIVCLALATAVAHAQWQDPPTSGYATLNTFLQSLSAAQTGSGAPSSSCRAGKDVYTDTSVSPGARYYCDASNHWTKFPLQVFQLGQSNTVTTGLQDFSAATHLRMPVAAGYTPTTTGHFGFDSTAGVYKGFAAGAVKTFAYLDSNILGTAAGLTGYSIVTTVGNSGINTNIPTEAAVRAAITASGGGDLSSNVSSSVNQQIGIFSGTSGKLITPLNLTGLAKLTAGVPSAAVAGDIPDLSATYSTKTAGADLSGNLPSPTVIRVNGTLRTPELGRGSILGHDGRRDGHVDRDGELRRDWRSDPVCDRLACIRLPHAFRQRHSAGEQPGGR